MSLLDTLLEAARYIELQERGLTVPSTNEEQNGVTSSPVKFTFLEASPDPAVWTPGTEYVIEEPKSPLPVRVVNLPGRNGAVSPGTGAPPPPAYVVEVPPPALAVPPIAIDFTQEHSRPRNNPHGPPQIPSPPSVGSSGSSGSSGAPRAGTREVHNKLEKNRRAHLKECFEMLKRQLPATPDDKKTSNLSILGSAIRYIQVLRRKERECEHEMERLAREKIAAQQRLAALKREAARGDTTTRPRIIDVALEEKLAEENINGHVPVLPISVNGAVSTGAAGVVGSFSRHSTLTLAALAPAINNHQGGGEALSAALVHPAQIHLPISQMGVGVGGVVMGGALQLLAPAALRLLPHTNGVKTIENNRIPRENGVTSPPSTENVMLASSNGAPRLVRAHTLTHKMVETSVVSASGYVNAVVKPLVVVSAPPAPPHR